MDTPLSLQSGSIPPGEPSPRPRHVAGEMQRRIHRGGWPAGSRLPTTRQLAGQFGVSLSTIQAAVRELEIRGLVQRRPRVGLFVSRRPDDRRRNHQVAMLLVRLDGESSFKEGTWTQRIQHSAQERLAEAGLQLLPVAGGIEQIERWEAGLGGGDLPAGVISFVGPGIAPLLERLARRGVPWITITPLRERMIHNFVSADNFRGGRLVGRCFGRLGLHRCLLLGEPVAPRADGHPVKVSTRDKIQGFLQGCLEEGMPLRGIEYAWNTDMDGETSAYRHTLEYLDRFGPPQGIFAEGDFVALGAIGALRERGVDIPNQTSVVGGTGLLVGEYAHPALTALGQPMEQMGQAAAEILLKIIDEGLDRVIGQYIPCQMLLRQSLRLNDEIRQLIEAEEAATATTPA